jgi:hypothetical protein
MRHESAVTLLYCSAGQAALDQIAALEWTALPMPLPEQPNWLAADTAQAACSAPALPASHFEPVRYLLRLAVEAEYADELLAGSAGALIHLTARKTAGLNRHLLGQIELVRITAS